MTAPITSAEIMELQGVTPQPHVDPAVLAKANALLNALLAGAVTDVIISSRGRRARIGRAPKQDTVSIVACKADYTIEEAERLGVALLAFATFSRGAAQ